MRTTKVIEEMRPHNKRAPFVRLRGKWLEAYGIKAGVTVYIHETIQGLLLTTEPPQQFPPSHLETVKAEFQRLGISTERK